MDNRPTPRSAAWRRLALFLLPAALLLAGLACHGLLTQRAADREAQAVSLQAERATDALERRVRNYAEVLYGLRGLFAASERVTYDEFHTTLTAQRLRQRYPGVFSIGVLELTTPARADALARRVRSELAASHQRYGRFRAWPDTPSMAVATMIELEGGRKALGFNARSEPRREAAIERALDTDAPTATAPIQLVSDRGTTAAGGRKQTSFSVLLPIGDRSHTVEGLVYAAFRMEELVDGALGADRRGATVEVYDRGSDSEPAAPLTRRALMYSATGKPEAIHPADGSRLEEFELLGRRWAVYYAPSGPLTQGEGFLGILPLIAGAALALLAVVLLRATGRTERRALALAGRMTEDLRASQEELARSNAELERFAYVASHDLREPLRTVNGFVGLLSRRYRDRLDDDGKEFIDHAVDGVHRMDGLIAELLQYSRAGRREAGAEPTDLTAAWNVAVRNLSAAIAESGAIVSAGPLPVVLAERGEMVQVLQNLLGNAIKYRSGHGPRIHASAVALDDGRFEISVTDDGPGIAPRDHERIFVLLQRLHRYDEVEGSGIGLSLCRRIVERHGGAIWVESDLGQGARFAFSLPAAECVPAADDAHRLALAA